MPAEDLAEPTRISKARSCRHIKDWQIRGLKQLTGRDNYLRCGQAIGEDLVANPERLVMPVNAALSAGWFWKTNGLNELADRGDVVAMTKRINGGTIGLEQRQKLYAAAMA